jgi:hypothetical protein
LVPSWFSLSNATNAESWAVSSTTDSWRLGVGKSKCVAITFKLATTKVLCTDGQGEASVGTVVTKSSDGRTCVVWCFSLHGAYSKRIEGYMFPAQLLALVRVSTY